MNKPNSISLDQVLDETKSAFKTHDPRGRLIAVVGHQDEGLLSYIDRFAPEIRYKLDEVRSGLNLLVDLQSKRAWRGEGTLEIVTEERSHALVEDLQDLISLPKRLLTEQELASDHLVVILGGGKGSRMMNGRSQKICAEIGTRSATERALEVYQHAGIAEKVLVVGHRNDQVIRYVARRFSDAAFVLQPELLGTGHAARQAMYLLEGQDYEGNILVVAGDKVVSKEVIVTLLQQFKETGSDLMLACAPKARWPNSGRVLLDSQGHVAAIVEAQDIRKMKLLESMTQRMRQEGALDPGELLEWILGQVPNLQKAEKMFGPDLLQRLEFTRPIDRSELETLVDPSEARIHIRYADGSSGELSADEVEARCTIVNVSVYLFKSQAFYHAVKRIRNDNAQREYYLTDVVEILCGCNQREGHQKFKISALELEDPEQVLGFNNDEELNYIRRYLRARAIERLKQNGVIVDPSAESSDVFWVDDIDSVDKIGAGTRLEGDVVIDLGNNPDHRIGSNCVLKDCKIIDKNIPDGTKIVGA